ncbi:hypothetical protein PP175_28775 (plasmid) [Aneurinibacillus sp. Ricciae_BoGa-3]|uniref:hypothetical protein n=1 Tax=Aneurinibacillus sp. Ricciae_BoGa-3 TaxID=3022697 RepID=UPI0023427636|nr:hypothetical protein [Aneurinibacillus sp. Ricciae_BoGa-3]WCK57185.1 hypothetical protein PP175_28775 [Aneurinibacillus sp. Ricciae_BoGa-3]
MKGYTLSFQEAIEKCIKGEGFIRGELFQAGLYVKNYHGVLVEVDGKKHHEIVDNLMISTGLFNQKFKLFCVVNPKELEIDTAVAK